MASLAAMVARCRARVLTAFACPSVQQIAIAALVSAAFAAANHCGIKAESRARAGKRAHRACRILPVRPRAPCPPTSSTARSRQGILKLAERIGANRSAQAERQFPATAPRSVPERPGSTAGGRSRSLPAWWPGPDAAAGTPGRSCCTRRSDSLRTCPGNARDAAGTAPGRRPRGPLTENRA